MAEVLDNSLVAMLEAALAILNFRRSN